MGNPFLKELMQNLDPFYAFLVDFGIYLSISLVGTIENFTEMMKIAIEYIGKFPDGLGIDSRC